MKIHIEIPVSVDMFTDWLSGYYFELGRQMTQPVGISVHNGHEVYLRYENPAVAIEHARRDWAGRRYFNFDGYFKSDASQIIEKMPWLADLEQVTVSGILSITAQALSPQRTDVEIFAFDEYTALAQRVSDDIRGVFLLQPTEASADDKHDNSTAVTNVSGGINLSGEQNYIGGDAVGRDKIIYNIGSNAIVTFVNGGPLNNPPSVPDGHDQESEGEEKQA